MTGNCGNELELNDGTYRCDLSDRHDTHPTSHACHGVTGDRAWSLYWTEDPTSVALAESRLSRGGGS